MPEEVKRGRPRTKKVQPAVAGKKLSEIAPGEAFTFEGLRYRHQGAGQVVKLKTITYGVGEGKTADAEIIVERLEMDPEQEVS